MKKIAHTYSGLSVSSIPIVLMFSVVTMKLMAPSRLEMVVRWMAKIAKSTLGPEWAAMLDRGGYTVHPVPAPLSIRSDPMTHTSAGGSIQKLTLFSLANAMSTAPMSTGRKKFPSAPMRIGMMNKKIIPMAWAVTMTLNTWLLLWRYWLPGPLSSILMITDIPVATIALMIP